MTPRNLNEPLFGRSLLLITKTSREYVKGIRNELFVEENWVILNVSKFYPLHTLHSWQPLVLYKKLLIK